MKKENTSRFSADQIRREVTEGKTQTDWARVESMSDDEILQSMKDDPNWSDFIDLDWSKASIVYPVTKSAISIRLDDDVIDFFKSDGKGYQSRINAVLRHFMTEKKQSKRTG